MALVVQPPRLPSPLERDIFDLVFEGSIDPTDINVYVAPFVTVGDQRVGASYSWSTKTVSISIESHQYTDNLDSNSTRANTDLFKPGNLQYLNTFIHECTHHWQITKKRFRGNDPDNEDGNRYNFSTEDLANLSLWKEAHASAVATWAVVGWQLEYRTGDVNLTDGGRLASEQVGTVDRYDRIRQIPNASPHDPGPRGRWVSPADARSISDDFNRLLNHLRNA